MASSFRHVLWNAHLQHCDQVKYMLWVSASQRWFNETVAGCSVSGFNKLFRSDLIEVVDVKQLNVLIIFSQQQLYFKLDKPAVVILLFCWQFDKKGQLKLLLLLNVAALSRHGVSQFVNYWVQEFLCIFSTCFVCFFLSANTLPGQTEGSRRWVTWNKSHVCSVTTILRFGFCAPETALGWICGFYWLENTSWRAVGMFVTSWCCWGVGGWAVVSYLPTEDTE